MMIDPIELENLRNSLALISEDNKFRKLYLVKIPKIKNNNSAKLWDKLNARKHRDSTNDPMTGDKLKIVSSYIPNESVSLLNVGCGNGDLENITIGDHNKENIDWHGIDMSPRSIKTCKKEFPKAHFKIGDIRKLPYEDKKFDMITTLEVLEHISPKDTFKVLGELNRVLVKGGKLIVTIPINEGLGEMIRKGENPNAHVRAYTKNIIKKELELSGFRVINIKELYAFNNYYYIKSFIAKYILKGFRKPNNLIIYSNKI